MLEKAKLQASKGIAYKKEAIKMILLTIIILIPSLTFIVIFYINPNIKIYHQNYQVLKDYFSSNVAPSIMLIKLTMWLAFSVALVALVICGLTALFYHHKRLKKALKNVFVFVIIVLVLVAIVIFAVSQYFYSNFYNIFKFMVDYHQEDSQLEAIGQAFAKSFDQGQQFKWSGNVLTWWVCFAQIVAATVVGYMFLIKLNPSRIDKEQEERIKVRLIKKSIGQSKFQGLVARISVNSIKTLSIWLMVVSILILLPQLSFIISISADDSMVGSVFDWTYKAPWFFKQENAELYNAFANNKISGFVIIYLPIIVTGFLISSTIIFLLIYLKDLEINKNLFIAQFILLFVELVVVIIVNTVSIYQINQLITIWNSNDHHLLKLITTFKNTAIFNTTIFKYADKGISDWFISGNQYISLCIISIALTVCIYTIALNKMIKITKPLKTL